jgi:hypothetical protein
VKLRYVICIHGSGNALFGTVSGVSDHGGASQPRLQHSTISQFATLMRFHNEKDAIEALAATCNHTSPASRLSAALFPNSVKMN